ncbi:UDP-N-acetylmuramate dehydrogenase [Planctomicrobium piriforme]|uniref:UDP-N-acetylenolpyruvoylglucosamine reductase n=1 Tax=Planctomicrobium piriforme TaxID=1576369 RepID=A0A1I3G1V8_9PLAN|nr:UDP-N-acetylmuramate dehydrogenase [Planctomicrobium piriforme]SFI17141.1 UDP-N-acetylmuramate dehydrogenase [Planctomicrobium piriforme]
MTLLTDFGNKIRLDEPLAQHTWLKLGGPAQMFAEPESVEELQALVQAADAEEIPVRLLGGGSNLLIRDEGVSGLVIRLAGDVLSSVSVEGNIVHAGGAALLSHVISQSVSAGLAGLESLVGIPGTIGGAVRGNAGGRHGEIGEVVRSVEVMTTRGEVFVRSGDELTFEYRFSSINELVILSVELDLKRGDVEELTRRMRQLWITKKASQPFSFQSAGCIFKNPRGLSAGSLIEQSGLKGTRIGGAEVSDRHANFIVTHAGATSADVLNLIELIQSRVRERHGIDLEVEIKIW